MHSENIGGHETESIVHLKKEVYSSYSNLLIDLIYNSLDVKVYLVIRMQNFNLCTRQITLELISIEMDLWMNDVVLFLVSITTLVFRFFIQFSGLYMLLNCTPCALGYKCKLIMLGL